MPTLSWGAVRDLRVAYGAPEQGWQVYGGVDNVFDRNPPVNLFGAGFGSALYEALGRRCCVGFQRPLLAFRTERAGAGGPFAFDHCAATLGAYPENDRMPRDRGEHA